MTTTATAARPRRARRRLRLADGVWRLRMMTLAGIATVLITRAYLAATGYPRIGGGGIHIGHVVWGGLLMIAALTVALVWAGDRARVWTALLGGVGIGLFVDEVGKYLTTTNDYFYRPAAAIIYLVFAALLVLAALLGRDTAASGAGDASGAAGASGASERLAGAAQIAANGLVSGLTPDERDHATRLLDGCADQDRDAVLRLLAQAQHRDPGRLTRAVERVRGWTEWIAGLRWTETVVFVLLILSRVIVAIIFIAQAAGGEPHSTDAGAITASAFTRGASAVLTIAAVVMRIRGRRLTAYRLAKAAILLDLIVTEVFNFHDSQFGAVAELPHLVLAFVFISIWQRQVEAQTSPAS
ncbi:hypothetical protein ABH920_007661 [Catenulispora sp. EB89]|uniref:hypothetical protein n=1 Tax=Catenulispora sp. EB89 TaxID=3156257 RepID=UPI0035163123